MAKARVTHLRHIGVGVPDYDKQVAFYEDVWGLKKVDGENGLTFLAAEGSPEQYVLRIRAADEKRVDLIAFGAEDKAAVDALATQVAGSGAKMVSEPGTLQTPGGGYGFRFFDPDGRTVEVSSDVAERPFRVLEPFEAIPQKLSHVVLHSPNPQACTEYYEEYLGFKSSGWLGDWFGFLRCGPDFHTVAIVRNEHVNLHHIAFELRSYEEWMRGVGRVLGAGTPMPFGLGSHAPAGSSFAYFLDPNGNTSEYIIPQWQIVDDERFDAKVWKGNVSDVWGTARSQNMPEAPLPDTRQAPDPGVFVAPPV
jgi:catechol 2,3-dioxygenase-like lactoylglutathione lyase family enzyme